MAGRSRELMVALLAATAVTALALPLAAASEVRVFRGLNADGLAARDNVGFGFPPDPTGAIGPSHYVEVVNTRLAVYKRRRLTAAKQMDAYDFWRQERVSTLVDPAIAWDRQAKRWYHVMLRNQPDSNAVLFAWSKGTDPSHLRRGWCRFEIPVGQLFDDFPRLGFSRNHILIGTNVFDLGTRQFQFSRVWAIGKPDAGERGCDRPPVSALGSASEPLREADGRKAVTPVPVVPVHPSNRGYVVAADCIDEEEPEVPGEEPCRRAEPRGRQISVWHISGPPGDPRLVEDGGIDVPFFRVPKPIPQPRTKRRLDASDTRLTQAVSNRAGGRRGDSLIWTQHAVASKDGSSKVRWYALDPERLSVVRRGAILKRRNWVFNAAISPTRSGDSVLVHYNVGGPELLPQIRARVVDRSPGGEVTLARSAAPEESCGPGEPFCGWGDYAGATPDPTRPNVVWGSNQVMRPKSESEQFGLHWGTRNFALRAR